MIRAVALALLAPALASAAPQAKTIEHAGRKRVYYVHVPPNLEPGKKVPLVLALHGGFGTGENFERKTPMDAAADRHGFIAAYPDGVRFAWNAGACCGRPAREKIDDAGFLVALVGELARKHPVDLKRVYATGISNGAMMAYRLACERPETFAAIAPVSGTMKIAECKPSRPVSVLHIHGTADDRAPYQGGEAGGGITPKRTDLSVADAMSLWKTIDGCGGSERQTLIRGSVVCVSYGPCREGSDVELCTIHGGRHNWPGGTPTLTRALGVPTKDLDAAEAALSFFEKHSLP